jgi:hypothetical protein
MVVHAGTRWSQRPRQTSAQRRGRPPGRGPAAPASAPAPRRWPAGRSTAPQRAQPRLEAVERPLGVGELVVGAAVADRHMPVLLALGQAAEPAVQQAGHLNLVQRVVEPGQLDELLLLAAAWPAAVHHSRSPWTVDSARPWAVWVWRLASYSTFWLVHPPGRCTRVPSPSTSTASPEQAISESQQPSSARLVMKLPSGWQKPSAPSSPSSRSMLSPTSVLEMPTMRPARRYDSPSGSTAATASRRISSGSGGVPPRPGGAGGARWARRAASQPSTVAGSDERGNYDDTGPDLLAGFEPLPMVWSPSTSGYTEHHGHPQWVTKRLTFVG